MPKKQTARKLPQEIYRHLAPRPAELLYHLAVLENRSELATREKLATMLETTQSNVSNILNQVTSAHPAYLKSDPCPTIKPLKHTTKHRRKGGRPPAAYYLNASRVISLSETAVLALEAERLYRQPGRLRKSKLIRHLIQQYGFKKSRAEMSLSFCLKNFYLVIEGSTKALYPSPSDRIMAERTFLQQLAADYRLPGNKPLLVD